MKKNTALKRTVFLPKGEPPLAHISEVKAAARVTGLRGGNGEILIAGELELEICYLVQGEEKPPGENALLLEKLEEAAQEPVSQPLHRETKLILPWELVEAALFTEETVVTAEVAQLSFIAVSSRAVETDILLLLKIGEESGTASGDECAEIAQEEAQTEEAIPETSEEVILTEEEEPEGMACPDQPLAESPPPLPDPPAEKQPPAEERRLPPPAKYVPLSGPPPAQKTAEKNARKEEGPYSMRFYRVLPSETLDLIAQKTGAEASALSALNGLGGKEVKAGEILIIP
ncbi:MAG: LysM peptidoglycan-binding domain-containing protein [Clostridiales bacterium]|nr:LysM peptidoglycan-binding domain-containing protein [Clostridiales bacterium]